MRSRDTSENKCKRVQDQILLQTYRIFRDELPGNSPGGVQLVRFLTNIFLERVNLYSILLAYTAHLYDFNVQMYFSLDQQFNNFKLRVNIVVYYFYTT